MSVFAQVLRDDIVVHDQREVRVKIAYGGLVGDGRVTVSVAAAVPGCGPLHVRAAPGSYFFPALRQDARTGHAAFDDRYIVKTNDVDLLRFWFGDREFDMVLATYNPLVRNPFTMELDGGIVALTAEPGEADWDRWSGVMSASRIVPIPEPGPHVSIDRLDEAIAAAAWIGNRGERLAEGWRDRAAALGGQVDGAWWTGDAAFSIATPRGRHPIRIDFPLAVEWSSRQSTRTRVWCPRAEPGASIAALYRRQLARALRPRLAKLDGYELDLGGLRGPVAVTPQPPPAAIDTAIDAADVDWLVIDETAIAAGWESIIDDTTELAPAIDLVAALADWLSPPGRPDGPYR